MSDVDYHALSDFELVERLEKGEIQTNSNLLAEFMRRMEELGTVYHNTPSDESRWFADTASRVQKK